MSFQNLTAFFIPIAPDVKVLYLEEHIHTLPLLYLGIVLLYSLEECPHSDISCPLHPVQEMTLLLSILLYYLCYTPLPPQALQSLKVN